MKEIKCPKCGTIINVSDTDVQDIINQVRNDEFDAEVARRVEVEKKLLKAEEDKKTLEGDARHKEELNKMQQRISALNEQIKNWEENKQLEIDKLKLQSEKDVSDAVAKKQEELLKKDAELAKEREKAAAEKENLEKEIELYKNFKVKRSVKLLGEDLEQHCYAVYNSTLLPVMPNAKFTKDNEAVKEEGEEAGTKVAE